MIGEKIRDQYRFHAGQQAVRARHEVRNVYTKTLRDLEGVGFAWRDGLRLLDLGCGQRYPFALLAAAHGAQVTALDTEAVRPEALPVYAARIARHSGVGRAVRSVARRVMFDREYSRCLQQEAGCRLDAGLIRFVEADASGRRPYPLPDRSFDLIVSNSVLEHVADLDLCAREVDRLLDDGGLFFGLVHNWFSISGGHNLNWLRPDEWEADGVDPWDHLRRNQHPTHVFVNKQRPEAFVEAFGAHLDVLLFEARDADHDPGGVEGERYLTAEVEAELAGFPRDLLLTRAYALIARKR